MWMRRFGWDAICRETDGDPGGGPGDIGGVQGALGAIGVDIGDVSQEQADAPSGVSGADVGLGGEGFSVSRGMAALQDPTAVAARTGLGLANPVLGAMAALGGFMSGAAPPGEVGPPGAEPGEAGAGPGGEADQADLTTSASDRLARSVRSAGVDQPGTGGGTQRQTPAPGPTVPTGPTQADLDRERREAAEERRRRAARRQGRQSTIVTGPLGVFGPPELLQPRAIAGASKRLLGA